MPLDHLVEQLMALEPGESITVNATLDEMALAIAEIKRRLEAEGRKLELMLGIGLESIDLPRGQE